jgi:hypothetical protein
MSTVSHTKLRGFSPQANYTDRATTGQNNTDGKTVSKYKGSSNSFRTFIFPKKMENSMRGAVL